MESFRHKIEKVRDGSVFCEFSGSNFTIHEISMILEEMKKLQNDPRVLEGKYISYP